MDILWLGTVVILIGLALQVIEPRRYHWLAWVLDIDEEDTERVGRWVMWAGLAVAVPAGLVHLTGWA